jgi:hypothetical protein
VCVFVCVILYLFDRRVARVCCLRTHVADRDEQTLELWRFERSWDCAECSALGTQRHPSAGIGAGMRLRRAAGDVKAVWRCRPRRRGEVGNATASLSLLARCHFEGGEHAT